TTLALYELVVADARAPRDSRCIEKLGTYNPLTVPATVDINDARAIQWIMNDAQPTDTVKSALSSRGVLLKKQLQIAVLKASLPQEKADARVAEGLKEEGAEVKKKAEKQAESKAAESKARKDAENEVKEARAEVIRKKSIVPEEEAAPAENAGEEQAAAPE